MNSSDQYPRKRKEAGSALLIAIFALLLISVVGLALVVSTGTDSALAGNYRNSTSAYYAAVAGLEEARGRLLWKNPTYIGDSYANFIMADVHNVVYILNPAGGESVNPLDSSSPFADTEYSVEFPSWSLAGATVQTISSVFSSSGPPGPLYKWVRINSVTEQALNLDLDGGGINPDSTAKLYYTSSGLTSNSFSGGTIALEVTALAAMPDKTKKLLQYVIVPNSLQYVLTPSSLAQSFPAALTIVGSGVSYAGPDSSGFSINGNDPATGRTCATPAAPSMFAIGVMNSPDQSAVAASTGGNSGNYVGAPPPGKPATPSVGVVTLPPSLQTPSQVEALIQKVAQNSDVQINKAPAVATGADLPTGMSPTNPMTVVVNGDLDLNAWHNTGYGILLVTGSLNYDPDASWEGIVLVLGKGVVTGSRMGNGRFDGAFLVAQSRDPITGAVLADPNLGAASVTFASNMGGNGIYYNTCTILQALAPTSYRVLSFREITQ